MIREILFRAKHIHVRPENEHLDGRWIYGYLADENYINSPELEGEFLIDPETICQYTGLHDSTKWEQLSENEKEEFLSKWNYKEQRQNIKEDWKGRKIFEGDIVKIDEYVKETFGVKDGKVLYYGGSFFVDKIRSLNSLYTLVNYEYVLRGEVIGNIFDNPELLKGETDGKDEN